MGKKSYVVFNGREPGVYNSWSEARSQVNGFSHNCHNSYKAGTAAEKAFETYVSPKSNGSSNCNSQESSQKKGYVVFQGREPGVYSSWPETHAQVSGYPNSSYKSYKTEASAKKAFKTLGK